MLITCLTQQSFWVLLRCQVRAHWEQIFKVYRNILNEHVKNSFITRNCFLRAFKLAMGQPLKHLTGEVTASQWLGRHTPSRESLMRPLNGDCWTRQGERQWKRSRCCHCWWHISLWTEDLAERTPVCTTVSVSHRCACGRGWPWCPASVHPLSAPDNHWASFICMFGYKHLWCWKI